MGASVSTLDKFITEHKSEVQHFTFPNENSFPVHFRFYSFIGEGLHLDFVLDIAGSVNVICHSTTILGLKRNIEMQKITIGWGNDDSELAIHTQFPDVPPLTLEFTSSSSTRFGCTNSCFDCS